MSQNIFFVNRRKGKDRREEDDPCKEMNLDLFNHKRRKSRERRNTSRSLSDDYYAYMQKTLMGIREKNREE